MDRIATDIVTEMPPHPRRCFVCGEGALEHHWLCYACVIAGPDNGHPLFGRGQSVDGDLPPVLPLHVREALIRAGWVPPWTNDNNPLIDQVRS
jgi:hypothetical protein